MNSTPKVCQNANFTRQRAAAGESPGEPPRAGTSRTDRWLSGAAGIMGHPLADAHKSMRRLLAFAWRSWLIPLGFGLAVAGAVWWWPAQPMWRSGPNAGKLWQFSA